MIDTDAAEKALDFLRRTAIRIEELERTARAKGRRAKLVQALAIERMGNANTEDKTPVTLRKEISWADSEVQAAFQEADEADAKLIGLHAERAAARDTIILHMSMVKDRM